jgi:phage/plasmid-like protein (TIGR03299 family)
MSHELEIVNGNAKMVYAGEVPWHGLGVEIPSDLTPEQVLEKAELDWTVEKETCFVKLNGKLVDAGIKALVRSTDGKILTHVKDRWEPVQNHDAFQFFHEYVMAGDMEMHTAGSLKGGTVVWALAKVKESFELKTPQGTDIVDSHLLFTNPHKFGQSIDIRFTPIRVVCNNTLTMALNQSNSQVVKVNHSRKFDAERVKETLGIANRYLNQYKDIAEFLVSKRYTKNALIEYFDEVFPKIGAEEGDKDSSRNAELAFSIIEQQPGAEFAAGSWWQAYNAVTYMTDHIIGRNTGTRLHSAWYGINQKRKLDALKTAKEYATAA